MNSNKDKDNCKSNLIHCRFCRYHQLERGGAICELLEVPVLGSWSACCLAASPFIDSADNTPINVIFKTKNNSRKRNKLLK